MEWIRYRSIYKSYHVNTVNHQFTDEYRPAAYTEDVAYSRYFEVGGHDDMLTAAMDEFLSEEAGGYFASLLSAYVNCNSYMYPVTDAVCNACWKWHKQDFE